MVRHGAHAVMGAVLGPSSTQWASALELVAGPTGLDTAFYTSRREQCTWAS